MSLYDGLHPNLVSFVQRRAEDVVADAFLMVWRRLEDVPRAPDDARAWVFGTIGSIWLNERRASGGDTPRGCAWPIRPACLTGTLKPRRS